MAKPGKQTPPTAPNAAELALAIPQFANARLLCIGDVMLDRFIYGSVDRISPEAPIPIFSIEKESVMLGGAGNVVRNVTALGAQASFVSVVGDDRVGRELTQIVGKETGITPYLQIEKGRTSTKKTRYIAGNQQILRADKETKAAIREQTEKTILDILKTEMPKHDVVILSDYGKGALTQTLIGGIMALAAKEKKPVVVDPKGRDYRIYSGAFILSPNLHELELASDSECKSEEEIIEAAKKIIRECNVRNMLVTRSKEGMTLVSSTGEVHHIAAKAREVYDVSGAGDTAIATLATALAANLTLEESAFLANVAAGIVVGKLGTATVNPTDLKTALHMHSSVQSESKILPLESAAARIERWKQEGLKVGFTNGCFDLLHQGHVSLLHDAKNQCDKLIVGVNSDDSVKRLKGPTRPVNGEVERALVLAALSAIDLVVIFTEDTPMRLIENFKPDMLFKGADYRKDQVVGGNVVEGYGGKVVLIPLQEGYSTTGTIARATTKK